MKDMMEQQKDYLDDSITFCQSRFNLLKSRFEETKHFTVRIEKIQDCDVDLFVNALMSDKSQREWQVVLDSSALITLSVSEDKLSGPGAFLCSFAENQLRVNALAALLSADTCGLDFKSLYQSSSSVPTGWDDNTWKKARQMIGEIKHVLETQDHKQFNNENILRKFIGMSNYGQLVKTIGEEGLKDSRTKVLQELKKLEMNVNDHIAVLMSELSFLKEGISVGPEEELKIIEKERQHLDIQRNEIEKKIASIEKQLSADDIRKKLSEVAIDEQSVLRKSKRHTLPVQKMEELAEEYEVKIMLFELRLMESLEETLQGIIDFSSVRLNPNLKRLDFDGIKIMARNECSFTGDDGILVVDLEKERNRISYLIGKRLVKRVASYSQDICLKADAICQHINKRLSKQLQRLDESNKELDDRQDVLQKIAKLDVLKDGLRNLQEDIILYIKTIES